MSKPTATAIGFVAVLLWALLALFTAASGKVPPFQLNAMAFAVGSLVGMARLKASRFLRKPCTLWSSGSLFLIFSSPR